MMTYAIAWAVYLLGRSLFGEQPALMAGVLWQKLEQTQKELARQSADSASDAKDARTTATETESQFQELQARLSVAEVRLSEVSLQRSQLDDPELLVPFADVVTIFRNGVERCPAPDLALRYAVPQTVPPGALRLFGVTVYQSALDMTRRAGLAPGRDVQFTNMGFTELADALRAQSIIYR